MKKSCIGLLIAALGVIPATGFAQVKLGAKAEAGATIDADAEGADAKAGGDASAKGEGDAAAAGEGDLGAEGEGVGDICKIDPAACPVLDMKKEAARPIKESIYAVQQLYVMRAHGNPSPLFASFLSRIIWRSLRAEYNSSRQCDDALPLFRRVTIRRNFST